VRRTGDNPGVGADLLPGDLSRFVARHFGARGRAWLERVPELVDGIAAGWGLEIEHALGGGLLSCVLAAHTRDGEPVVLKIAGPWGAAGHEAAALVHWDAGPAPRLLGFDGDRSALLLERIWPGGTVPDESCDRVAQLITALHAVPPTSTQIASLPSLAEVIEERLAIAGAEAAARSAAESAALAPRLQRAQISARELLSGYAGPSVLLHGDLEQRNVLRCQRRVLAAIDPMPCIGDPAYDAAYWAAEGRETVGVAQRCQSLAVHMRLDPVRVRRWASIIMLALE
jgi:streptomycin 6-kinase